MHHGGKLWPVPQNVLQRPSCSLSPLQNLFLWLLKPCRSPPPLVSHLQVCSTCRVISACFLQPVLMLASARCIEFDISSQFYFVGFVSSNFACICRIYAWLFFMISRFLIKVLTITRFFIRWKYNRCKIRNTAGKNSPHFSFLQPKYWTAAIFRQWSLDKNPKCGIRVSHWIFRGHI